MNWLYITEYKFDYDQPDQKKQVVYNNTTTIMNKGYQIWLQCKWKDIQQLIDLTGFDNKDWVQQWGVCIENEIRSKIRPLPLLWIVII